jgi:hypothetical protein
MDASTRQLCMDRTRVDLKKQLIDRPSRPSDSLHCEMIWLLGLAGSGKSTLLNSIAEHFAGLRQCGAFVFFNRSDAANSDSSHVIPTLAYHLAQFSPHFAEKLVEQVQARRDIRRISLKTQFEILLEEPSKAVAALTDQPPIIILIDGLDECGDEKSRKGLLEILSRFTQKLPPLFRILAASRDEKDIRSAFSPPDINIKKIDLRTEDDNTTRDIAEFFRQRLMSIAENSGRPSNWPGRDVIEQLTRRAGGLFIWASTAVGFIEDGPPDARLQTLLDISAQGESLVKLDKLYQLTVQSIWILFPSRARDLTSDSWRHGGGL